MFAPKQILVPTDFSEYSDRAIREAIDIAKQFGAKIYLLHVINIVHQCSVDYCMDSALVDQLEKQSEERTKSMFREELDRISGSKSVDITTGTAMGLAYEEILNEQQKKSVDLIVIASHGKTGLLHHLMGSVADKVLKSAKCPVLLVRG